jgi:hypothetical protein
MKPGKKTLPKKIRNEEAEKKIYAIFEKADNGDVESMMRILMESGRGYEMSEADLSEILNNRREGG